MITGTTRAYDKTMSKPNKTQSKLTEMRLRPTNGRTTEGRTPPPTPMTPRRNGVNIGISEENIKGVVILLNRTLSNASILTIKTRKFHWDISGPQFIALHKLWDEQYTLVTEYVDQIAECVRARGGFPIGTAVGFLEHSNVKEHPGAVASATQAVETLLDDHELVARTLRDSIDKCAVFADAGATDFLTGMLRGHEQMAWMLRSFLEGEGVRASGKVSTGTIPTYA